jgi:hypothetical protein
MAKRKQKRVPLGQAIQWTDADLDALSNITEADIKEAGGWWQDNAPKKYKKLLEAKPDNAAAENK